MKPLTRKATVIWLGMQKHGKAAIATTAALRKTPYVFDTHLKAGRGTNPPKLIAAAHAGSFSMALANELEEAGYSPVQIETTATVAMEGIAAGWTMTQIHLDVIATVPNAAQCDFIDAALRAKSSCPISRLLDANISMRAKLTRRANASADSTAPKRRRTPEGKKKHAGKR
jgi:osmotically inducible protein OsmC